MRVKLYLCLTATEFMANIWQENIYKPLGGLGYCPFWFCGSVVVLLLFGVALIICGELCLVSVLLCCT